MRSRSFGLYLTIATLALLALPALAGARVLHVRPGDSIQAAVDEAHAGDTVLIAPGTYRETGGECPPRPGRACAVAVTEDGISIVGRGDRAATESCSPAWTTGASPA